MLSVNNIEVSYGSVQVIHRLSIKVEEGECVTIVGSNGAGKTTTLRTISGLLRPISGTIEFQGQKVDHFPPYEIAKLGIAHVPEGRGIFPQMTVRENLELGAYVPSAKKGRKETLDRVFQLFPRLKERQNQLAVTLSGGEQQMLVIGRGLMLEPKLLMLDEPSLGLAPILAEAVFEKLEEIRGQGIATLLVEQNVYRALTLARRGHVLENGHVVLEGNCEELLTNSYIKTAYLGV